MTASYLDEFARGGRKNRLLTNQLTATYYNAKIKPIAYEFSKTGNGAIQQQVKDLMRIDPGERIVLEVTDYDMDVSSEVDKVPVQFVLKLRPLSTAEEVVETIDIEHFSDLIKNPGALLSRTRLVNDFAKLATGAGHPQVTPQQLDDALSGQTASDWGLAEIQHLTQTRF